MEIILINPKILLVSSPERETKRVNDGGLSSIILADNGSKARVECKRERILAFAKRSEVLNTKLR